MPKRISSVVGRSFGDGVRDAIRSTGMTQRQIAELLGWEEAKVSDLVQGKGGVTEAEVAQLLGLCRVEAAEVRRLLTLFNESREKGYLQFVEDGISMPGRTLMEQERHANKIVSWSLVLVPGLLQIAAYVRAVSDRAMPRKPQHHHDEMMRVKLQRQAVFHRSREFVFYIHENALRLPVVEPNLMKEQLLHILTMSMRPYVTVRVLPLAAGAHAGVEGSFSKLSFEKFEPVIFLENARTALFLEDKSSLTYCDEVLKGIDELALDVEESRVLISRLLP
ncbi:helix-turn-helix transcriptional regulator [Lentzea sp. BCCO 10_0856]|uniref:Helix-turn-helix transcriptional regulator n=1 Tax=Lentzea miocenica TaxID=3095431 RepID=A0ABU4T2C6_9PSEU|nr:helix-turn-helix transcriptional regulator [Lentzea sp. BCCO 10_0856]MDX8032308.1 helix-turn-helix transcriptional regulator [Lentzea sp. BCCO 10_0856]